MSQILLDLLPADIRSALVFCLDAADVTGVSNGASIPAVTDFISGVASGSVGSDVTYAADGGIGRPAIDFLGEDAADNTITFADSSLPLFDAALKSTELTLYSVAAPRRDQNSDNIFEYNSKIRLIQSARKTGTTLPNSELQFVGAGVNTLSAVGVSFSNNYPEYTGGTLSKLMLNGSHVKNRDSRYSPNSNNRNIHIGSNQGVISPFDGPLYLLVAFNRELSEKEMALLDAASMSYLGQPVRGVNADTIIALDGNSIPNSIGADNGEDENGFSYVVAQSLSLEFGEWHNVSRSGSNIQEAAASYESRIGWMESHYEKPVKVISNYWVNEDATGSDYAAEARAYMSLAQLNTYMIWGTPPHGGWDSAKESRRQQDIVDILANNNAAAIWPFHLDSQAGVAGSFTANPDLFIDSVSHMSAAGQAVLAASAVTAVGGLSVPGYIGAAVVTPGQAYIINEDTAVGVRLNSATTGVPAPLSWTGGGAASAYAISEPSVSFDAEGYPVVAVVNSTPGVITANVSVTNEAGQGANEELDITIVDVDTSQAPTIPEVIRTLTTDDISNEANGLLARIAVENVSGTPSLTGADADRFTLVRTGDNVDVFLVSALPVGNYIAYISGVDLDPDGVHSSPTISALSVSVVVNTDVAFAYDYDMTCGVKNLKDLEDGLSAGEWGDPIRINVGRKIDGIPSILFTPPTGSAFTITSLEGLLVGQRSFTNSKGSFCSAGEYLYYVIEQGRFDVGGEWTFRIIETLQTGGERKSDSVGFTVKF